MSINRPCCFCYTAAPAFVFPAFARLRASICWWIKRARDLPPLLWKLAQWPATAKSCKDKLLCNAFWQMRLSCVALLLIYRADASRSWAVGRQKFRERSSCCWLRGSLLRYFNWIRWAETEEADASGTASHLKRPLTSPRKEVCEDASRKVCVTAVCLLHLAVRRRGLIRLDMPPSVPFGAVEKYSTLQRRALTQIHQEKCFIFSLSLTPF